MSRLGSTLSRHRRENYSLDIKGLHRPSLIQTPFSKKKETDDKYFLKLKSQITQNTSMQSSGKQLALKPKRRFSLSKSVTIRSQNI
jgi:hypothetical protein